MSGRTASLLLALCLPALLSATCNPKKTQPGAAEERPAGPAPADDQPPGPGVDATRSVEACPGLAATAGPLGPAVAPACPSGGGSADPALEQSITELAAVHARGLAPLGPASPARIEDGPALVRSAVLQGPPHCYVLVARCEQEASTRLSIAAAGEPAPIVEAGGPALRFCPEATGSYDVTIAAQGPPLTCAARLYGD